MSKRLLYSLAIAGLVSSLGCTGAAPPVSPAPAPESARLRYELRLRARPVGYTEIGLLICNVGAADFAGDRAATAILEVTNPDGESFRHGTAGATALPPVAAGDCAFPGGLSIPFEPTTYQVEVSGCPYGELRGTFRTERQAGQPAIADRNLHFEAACPALDS